MSFDIFLEVWRQGEIASFKREVFEALFLPYCTKRRSYDENPSFMRVEFPDESGSDIYLDEEDDFRHITFNHSGGSMFFDAIYKLADQTKSVIFWPNSPSLVVVTNEAVLKELPADFPGVENPRIVHSGAEIIAAIESS
jgi:hypothetical protein